MIKLVSFDIDGVLISSKSLHYDILNKALQEISPQHVISLEEHATIFEGLPTKVKLQKLSELRELPIELHAIINKRKQELTKEVFENYDFEVNHHKILKFIKKKNIKLAACTNMIPQTTQIVLDNLGIRHYFDFILDNSSVSRNKPHPDIYILARTLAHCEASEQLIFEDSQHGLEAARLSGAHVQKVESPNQLNVRFIIEAIQLNNTN